MESAPTVSDSTNRLINRPETPPVPNRQILDQGLPFWNHDWSADLKMYFHERSWSLCPGQKAKTAFEKILDLAHVLQSPHHRQISSYQVSDLIHFNDEVELDTISFSMANNTKVVGRPGVLGLRDILILPFSAGSDKRPLVELVAVNLQTNEQRALVTHTVPTSTKLDVCTCSDYVIGAYRNAAGASIDFWKVPQASYVWEMESLKPQHSFILTDFSTVGTPIACEGRVYIACNSTKTPPEDSKIVSWDLSDLTAPPREINIIKTPIVAFELTKHWAVVATEEDIRLLDHDLAITMCLIVEKRMGQIHQVRTSGSNLIFSADTGIWRYKIKDQSLSQLMQPADLDTGFEVIGSHILAFGLPSQKETKEADLSAFHCDLSKDEPTPEPCAVAYQKPNAHVLIVNGSIWVVSQRTIHCVTLIDKPPAAPNTVDIDLDEPVRGWTAVAATVVQATWWLLSLPFKYPWK